MKQLLYLKDNQLKEFIEKLFVSYRETFADTKKILDKHKLGIAHQKVLHLISQYQGITISELLGKLKVTKQSLNRVLNDLIKIHKELLKSWYEIYAKVYLNDVESDQEAVCDIVFSYEKNDFNRIINKFIKELIMILPSNISNLIIQKQIYKYNE